MSRFDLKDIFLLIIVIAFFLTVGSVIYILIRGEGKMLGGIVEALIKRIL